MARRINTLFILKLFTSIITVVMSQTSSKMDYSGMNLPKLVAFDLDGTIWYPEMYHLWGGGAPFKKAPNGKDLIDRNEVAVKLLGITDEILHDLKTHEALQHVKVAWVSCTDEPGWADECLSKFTTSGGHALSSVVHSSQIFQSNKQQHFRNLKSQYPDIDYSEMLFFDNEHGNIASVSRLGVKCVYTPKGMTEDVWLEGLKLFN